MEHLDFEVRFAEDETRASPGRISGTLVTYETRAGDRPELFTRDSLYWPERGIVINAMHQRAASIVRVIPYLDGDELRFDALLPNTTAGRDAATNVREGVWPGASIEFKAEREGRRGNLREIRRARLGAAALVDTPAYLNSLVEVRAGLDGHRGPGVATLWL